MTEETGPLVWGEPGTNGQHAFYQLLHQGTTVIPCEFLIAANGHEEDLKHHHDLLVANCLAQSEALMLGRTLDEAKALLSASGMAADEVDRLAPHKVFPGDRPSMTLVYDQLTPFALGRLIALYEHRVSLKASSGESTPSTSGAWNWARNWPLPCCLWSRAKSPQIPRTPRPKACLPP